MILAVIKKARNLIITDIKEFGQLKIPFVLWEKFRLFDGIEADLSFFKQLTNEIEFYSAKNKALKLLGKRAYFHSELQRKLVLLKFKKETASKVLDEMVQLGFINDEKHLIDFINHKINIRRLGINRISNLLKSKGVDRKLIENVTKKFNSENSEKLLENIHILAEKKFKSLKRKEAEKTKIYQKLYSHLLLKGYDSDTIKTELRKYFDKYECAD